ncbi:MAG: tetratricopeptide repeat protein [Thermoplasmata archaeon]|nr:tetratricopeptide repeat protein [Thermoplasmata archaeon]
MGLNILKGREKPSTQTGKTEGDMLARVAATDVWKLNPDSAAAFVKDMISLLLTVPFSRDLHMRAPAHLPERIKNLLETVVMKTTELEVKFNSLVPSVELYYHLGCAHYNLARYPEAENFFDKVTKVDKNHFKGLLALGLTKMELGNDLGALETLKNLIELEPNNEAGWYTLGLVLYKLKKHDDEIECYERAIAINRKYEPAWNNRGLTFYELGKYGDAAENFAEALKINPRNEKFWHGLGLAHMKLNNLETALRDFDTATQVNPNYPEAWYSKAAVLLQLNKTSDALNAVNQALSLRKNFRDALLLKGRILEHLGKPGDAIPIFESLISEAPDDPGPYLAKAELMEKSGNTKDALAAIDKAISLSESHDAYLLKARILRKHGSHEDALRVYLHLLEKDRANYSVMKLAGECLYELGKYDDASQMFKKVLSVQVNSHDAWFWKGKCDIKRNAVKDGIHAMEMAISLSPKNVKYIRELIRVAKELGKRDLYLKYGDMLASLEQDNPEVWYEKANAYFEDGKLDAAENAVRKAISLRDDYPEALFLLAKIMHLKENYGAASEILENLVEKDNMNHDAWLFMAILKNEVEEYGDAAICAERALDIKKTAEGYYQYGLALKGLGKFAEAGNAFTKAYEHDNGYVRAILGRAEVLEALKSFESAFESYALAYQKNRSSRVLAKLIELGEKTGKIEETLAYLEEGIKSDDQNPDLRLAYGRILAEKGDRTGAIKAFEKGLMFAPDHTGLLKALFESYAAAGRYEDAVKTGLKIVETAESPEIWYSIGNLLLNLGKVERALECYQQAVALDPGMVDAYVARGKAFAEKGDFGNAAAEYLKAVEIRPDAYEPRFALASLMRMRKNYQEALEHIEKALETKKTPEAFIEKARILSGLGRFEDSVAAYEQAFQVSQQIPDILYEKALVLEKLGLVGPAIETLEKNLRMHRHERSALALIGILENSGQEDRALEVCEQGLKDYPENDLFMIGRERLLQKLGRFEELVAHYDNLLQKARTPEVLYKKAELLWKLKRYAEARESIEEALSIEKKPEYFLVYARTTADAGSVEGALSVLTKGLRSFKNHIGLTAEKARLLIAAGRHQEAEEIVEGLIEQEPENLEYLKLLAELKLSTGDYAGAIGVLEKIIRIAPDEPAVLRNLGIACFRAHRFEDALKWSSKSIDLHDAQDVREIAARSALALRRYDEALKHIEVLVKNNPENPEYLVVMGEVLAGLHRFIFALETYNRALRIQPDNLNAWYGRALALAKIGDVGEALNSIEKAIGYGKTGEALKLRAKLLSELGRYEDALRAYEELLASEPGNPELLVEKGITLARMKRDTEAEQVLLQVVAALPENGAARYHLGKIYAGRGMREEALHHLEKAIEAEPENSAARTLLAEIYLSTGTHGDILKAAEAYEAVLRYEPNNRQILYRIAEIHMKLENFEKAVDFINAFLADEPNSTGALYLKGKIFMAQRKWREATRTFEKLLKIEEMPEAHLDYARCLMELGKFEEARAQIERYIELKGKDVKALLALARCSELGQRFEEAIKNYTAALSIGFCTEAVEGKIRVLKETGHHEALFEFYKEVMERADSEKLRIDALEALGKFGSPEEIKNFIAASISKFPGSLQLLVKKGEFEETWGERENAVSSYRKALEISLTEPELWYRCAKLYRELGKLASAAECLDKAIELRPENPVYLEEKGNLAYAMLEVDVAVRNLDAALESDEERPQTWVSLGTIMHDIGRYAEALRCFERALEISENPDVMALSGRTLVRMGRVEEAIARFQKALSLDKNHTMARYFIGAVLARKGDPNGEKILSECGAMAADVEIQIGNLLLKKGRFEEAAWKYEEATKIERTKIEGWNNFGVALAMNGLYDEAVDAFDEAIVIEKEYGPAWYNKGIALLKIENWKEALDALTLSGNYEGFKPEIQTAIAIALLGLQRFENAIKLLDEVVVKTGYWKGIYNLALAYLHIGMPEKALEYAKMAYEKEKGDAPKYLLLYTLQMLDDEKCLEFLKTCENPSFEFWQFYLLKGYIQIRCGEFEDAIRCLDKAVGSGKTEEVWLLRAYAYLMAGKHQDARRSADAALVRGMRRTDGLTLRGVADYLLGNYEVARKWLEKAAGVESSAVTNYNLAAVYFKTGNLEKCLQHLGEALKLEPDNEKFKFYRLLVLREIERRSERSAEETTGEFLMAESRDSLLDSHDLSINLLVDQRKGVELTVKNEMFRTAGPFKLRVSGMLASGELEIPELGSKEEQKFNLTYQFNAEHENNIIPGIDVSINARLYSRHGKVHCEVVLKNLKAYPLKQVKVRAVEGLGYVALAGEKMVEILEPMEEKKLGFTMVPPAFRDQFESWKERFGDEMKPEIPVPGLEIPLPAIQIPEFNLEDDYEYTRYSETRLRRILKSMEIRSRAIDEMLKAPVLQETAAAGTALIDELELTEIRRR